MEAVMQAELEKWIEKHQYHDFGVGHVVEVADLRALLAGRVLCDAEPVGYLYQHEDSGRTTSVSAQAHDCGFERLNPRYTLIGPLHKPADIGKEGA
jgi:hypothetical protein